MVSNIYLIHSFNKELLSIYSVPSTGDTPVNRANKDPANVKFTIKGLLVRIKLTYIKCVLRNSVSSHTCP